MNAEKELKSAQPVKPENVKALRQRVEEILERVRQEGDGALHYFSRTFDGYEGPVKIGENEIEAARRELPADIIRGLDFAIERVTAFAQAQRSCHFRIRAGDDPRRPYGPSPGSREILCGLCARRPLSLPDLGRHVSGAGQGSRG